jgi:hypothetical protein
MYMPKINPFAATFDTVIEFIGPGIMSVADGSPARSPVFRRSPPETTAGVISPQFGDATPAKFELVRLYETPLTSK